MTNDTNRRTARLLGATVAILTIALVGLLIVLFQLLRDPAPEYRPVAGLQALRVILGPGVGSEPYFNAPMGAAFSKDGRVYVADTGNHRIVVFDSEGNYLFQFGGFGLGKPAPGGTYSWKPGLFNYPTDVATDRDGNVYVADFRNDQIQVFDAEGSFLRVFPDRNLPLGRGASGRGGTGLAVTSVCVGQDRVYATDRYQVVEFTREGKLLAQFGRPGSGDGEFDHLNGVAVNLNSMFPLVAVSDSNNSRVVGLTSSGRTIWTAGQRQALGMSTKIPKVEAPRGLVVRDDGSILVADALRQRILEISSTGVVVGSYGVRGEAPGALNFPTDVDALGERLVVAEKGNDRVQVMQLVGR